MVPRQARGGPKPLLQGKSGRKPLIPLHFDAMSEPTPRKRFPIARKTWKFAKKAIRNWRERHRHPFNFGIHLIGIPLTLIGLGLLPFLAWYWGIGLFVLGYLFQFLGHLVEGNDVGELIPIKKLLGLPVVAIVPRPNVPSTPPPS